MFKSRTSGLKFSAGSSEIFQRQSVEFEPLRLKVNPIEPKKRKMLVIVGGIMSLTMAASYIYPTVATVYIFSFVSGVGGAFLWVGQGAEVLANSNSTNIDYHSALFWFLYQISQFAGNLYVFFAWQGTDYINSKMRIQLYSILVGVGAFGLVCFAFIKLVPNEDSNEEAIDQDAEKKTGTEKFIESLKSVKQAIKYCGSPHFIQLMVSKSTNETQIFIYELY